MLMSLLLVHKSTSPFLLSLYRKELTLNLQSRRYQELPGSIPAIALIFANELFRLFSINISKIIRLQALRSRSVLDWHSIPFPFRRLFQPFFFFHLKKKTRYTEWKKLLNNLNLFVWHTGLSNVFHFNLQWRGTGCDTHEQRRYIYKIIFFNEFNRFFSSSLSSFFFNSWLSEWRLFIASKHMSSQGAINHACDMLIITSSPLINKSLEFYRCTFFRI